MKKFHPVQGKTVHIIFQSKGLGDTLAWFPYVEQFRVENKCKVKLFLPKQEMIPLLKPNYSKIEFLEDYKLRHKIICHFPNLKNLDLFFHYSNQDLLHLSLYENQLNFPTLKF